MDTILRIFPLLTLLLACGTVLAAAPVFEAGEGVVDISPPIGTALGGYRYRDPAKPRVSTGLSTPVERQLDFPSRCHIPNCYQD